MLELISNVRISRPEDDSAGHLLVGGGKVLGLLDEPLGWSKAALDQNLLRVHDGKGRRLVPGLIDNHVHLTGGGGEASAASKVPPIQLSSLTLSAITCAVGILGTDDTTRSTEELVTAARALTVLGLDAWCHTGGYHLPPTTLTGSVRRDITFLDRVIGVGEIAISDHRSSQPTLDEILRLAADAHVAGLMTGKAGILHLHLGDGDRGLDLVRRALGTSEIPPRVFHPTHVNRRSALLEEAFELVKLGCTIDVTAFPEPPAGADEVWAPDAIERYWKLDLPADRLTVSSDGGGCFPSFDASGRIAHYDVGQPSALLDCLRELLRRGHEPSRALAPFTSNVADHFRLAGKGRIEPGCDADLVLLDDDYGVDSVMVRGRWHVVAGRAIVRGPFEGSDPSTSAGLERA